jgi:hypothetical protein
MAREQELRQPKGHQFLPQINWLPGLVSQSAILWDRACLVWTRIVNGRITVRLLVRDRSSRRMSPGGVVDGSFRSSGEYIRLR